MFSRFDTIPACDRQTVRRTDRIGTVYLRRASALLPTHVKTDTSSSSCSSSELIYAAYLEQLQKKEAADEQSKKRKAVNEEVQELKDMKRRLPYRKIQKPWKVLTIN